MRMSTSKSNWVNIEVNNEVWRGCREIFTYSANPAFKHCLFTLQHPNGSQPTLGKLPIKGYCSNMQNDNDLQSMPYTQICTYDTFIAEDLTIDMISCQEQL